MLNTKEEIDLWLKDMDIKNYTINQDLTVDVSNNVILSNKDLIEIPIHFGIIKGDFRVNNNKLTSFTGFPRKAESVVCNRNQINSLKDCPKIIHEIFNCQENPITDIDNLPQYVGLLLIFSYKKSKIQYYEHLYKTTDNYLALSLEEARAVFLSRKLNNELPEKSQGIRIKI